MHNVVPLIRTPPPSGCEKLAAALAINVEGWIAIADELRKVQECTGKAELALGLLPDSSDKERALHGTRVIRTAIQTLLASCRAVSDSLATYRRSLELCGFHPKINGTAPASNRTDQ